MTELTRFSTDFDPEYEKHRKVLIKMFQPYVNYPVEKQLPIVIDVLSLYLAAIDGNGFYAIGGIPKNDLKNHQQYDLEALQILQLGIKAFMIEKNMPTTSKGLGAWEFPRGLLDTSKRITTMIKQLLSYNKKIKKNLN